MPITRISPPKQIPVRSAERLSADEAILDTNKMLWKAARNLRFNEAQADLSVILKYLPGFKAALRSISNNLISFKEGLETGDVTKKAYIEYLDDTQPDFTARLEEFIQDQYKQVDPIGIGDLTRDSLKVYDKDMNQVQQKLLKNGLFAGYLPVIPITRPPLSVPKLERVGYSAEAYAGYTFVKKQLVLGISRNLLAQHTSAKFKIDDVFKEFQESFLKKHGKSKYVAVGQPLSWWEARWVWLISPDELNLFKKCTIVDGTASGLVVSKWSLPFIR